MGRIQRVNPAHPVHPARTVVHITKRRHTKATQTANPIAEKAAAYLADPALLEGGMGWLREHYPKLTVEGWMRRGEPISEERAISEERVRIVMEFLLECKPGQQRHDTYMLKHRFEWWARRYVTTGDLVAACLLVGVPVDKPQNPSEGGWVFMLAPRDCKGSCGNRIPAGSRKRLCDQCRSLLGRR